MGFTDWFRRKKTAPPAPPETRIVVMRQPNRRLRRLFSAPPMPAAMAMPQGVTATQIAGLNRVNHPGHDLDPEKIGSIYAAAERGRAWDQADMFTDLLETDGHLRSAATSRLGAITGKPWRINAGIGKAGNDKQSEVLAELCHQSLKDTNFPVALAMSLASVAMGYSGTNPVWKRRDGDVIVDRFVEVPFRRFGFSELGEPRYIRDTANWDGIPLEPGRWWFTTPTSPFFAGTIPRLGLMRTASWYSMFKGWSWQDWVIYAEKFGVPFVLGKYDPTDTQEGVLAALRDSVENLGEDGSALLAKTAEIEIREAQRGGDSNGLHGAIVSQANLEISKLFTGATLNMESNGKGSYAQATVHAGREFHLVLADLQLAAESLKHAYFAPMREFNGLHDARLPELQVDVEREVNPLTRAEVRKIYWEMGLPLDEDQLYSDGGLRRPRSPEHALAGPSTPTPAGPPPPTPAAPDKEPEKKPAAQPAAP